MKRILLGILITLAVFTGAKADEFIIDEPGVSSADAPSETRDNKLIPSIGSLPTTDNLSKGDFILEFSMYENGGFTTRMMVGIFNVFSIGVFENIEGLIGNGEVRCNIPGAYVKVSLFDDPRRFNLAFGLDSFAYGSHGAYVNLDGLSSTIYGFYVSAGQSFRLLGARNIFTFGLRFPLLPGEFRNITNTTFYAGVTMGTPTINVGLTLEDVYMDFSRPREILPSLVVNFTPAERFRLSLALQYDMTIDRINRVLSLAYQSHF